MTVKPLALASDMTSKLERRVLEEGRVLEEAGKAQRHGVTVGVAEDDAHPDVARWLGGPTRSF